MASNFTMPFCLALLITTGCVTTTTSSAAEPADPAPAPVPAPSSAAAPAWIRSLATAERVGGEGSPAPQLCWETLMAIKSCTGEIILFFLNGEAYLGPGCCRAIRVIEQRCWAANAMLSAIGFTPQEGDMLKGYCVDGGDDQGQGLGASPPPPPPSRAADDGDAVGNVARESRFVSVAGRKHGPVYG